MKFVNFIQSKYVKWSIASVSILAIAAIKPINITYNDESLEIHINKKYNMNNKSFSLLLNDDEILTTKNSIISNFKKIDNEKPPIIQNVNHSYEVNGINLSWEEVNDKGTDNSYRVLIKNDKDVTIKSSNKITMNFSSGIESYKVYVNDKLVWEGEEVETFIKNEELKVGVNEIVVQAFDKAENYSEKKYEILYEEIKIANDNNVISVENTNKKDKYVYTLNVEGDDNKYDFIDKIDITTIFKDSTAPSKTNINVIVKDTNIAVELKSEDRGNKYKYQVSGSAEKQYNEVFGEAKEVEVKSNIKGYYYYIGEEANYKITDKDKFTENNEVSMSNVDYKTYYVHAIAIDGNNNKSEQATYSINIERPRIITQNITTKPNSNISADKENTTNTQKPSSQNSSSQNSSSQNNSGTANNDAKMNLILSMTKTHGEINYSQYNTHINAVYNYMPISILNIIKSYDVRIGYVSTNLRQFLINNEGYDPGVEIRGVYIPSGRKVFVSTTATVRSSIHEISHAFDRANAGGLRSQQADFYNLYINEGEAMFGGDSYYVSDEKEYFAEAFTKYLMDGQTLKAKAPKTYSYFKGVLGQ